MSIIGGTYADWKGDTYTLLAQEEKWFLNINIHFTLRKKDRNRREMTQMSNKYDKCQCDKKREIKKREKY